MHLDYSLNLKSWPNLVSESRPRLNFIRVQNISSKILNKVQFQIFAWSSTSKSWPNLCSKSEQKFSFMNKLQLPNLHKSSSTHFSTATSATVTVLSWRLQRPKSLKSSLLYRSQWVLVNDKGSQQSDSGTKKCHFAKCLSSTVNKDNWDILNPIDLALNFDILIIFYNAGLGMARCRVG